MVLHKEVHLAHKIILTIKESLDQATGNKKKRIKLGNLAFHKPDNKINNKYIVFVICAYKWSWNNEKIQIH